MADLQRLMTAFERAMRADAELRRSMARVASWFSSCVLSEQAASEAAVRVPATGDSPKPAADEPVARAAEPTAGPSSTVQVIGPLTPARAPIRGPVVVAPPLPGQVWPLPTTEAPIDAEAPEVDLSLVARRCTLKAEAARWASTRRRRLEEGADFQAQIRPHDAELGKRIKAQPDCFAWMLDPHADLPGDQALEDIAGCYENLAEASRLIVTLYGPGGAIETDREAAEEQRQPVYELLAEATSALRKGLLDWADVKDDRDQNDAFGWLRKHAFEERVYIARHMRINDPADPNAWATLRERIGQARSGVAARRDAERTLKEQWNKVRYVCRRLPEAADAGELAHQWGVLDGAVTQLHRLGVRPSNAELRDLVMPHVEQMPELFEPGAVMAQLLSSIDEFISTRERTDDRPRAAEVSSEAVRRVASWLSGREMVMIGGQCRPLSQQAMERAFGLASLRWISTRPHESNDKFEADVARAETACVVLAIRWASHSYEGVSEMCVRHGKPFVRLPRGYGVNQVAEEIVRQASGWMSSGQ